MCLIVSTKAKDKFLKRHKNKSKVIVWKVLNRPIQHNQPWTTLFRYVQIKKAGWFKAVGKLSKECVEEGVIHVYTTRQEARKNIYTKDGVTPPLSKLLRCEALLKDLIAVGEDNDACFSKIWIPKKEILSIGTVN